MARIVIAGGSLGGLFAANLLLRDGHDVHVLEKASGSLIGRGAGIVTHDALVRALARCGVPAEEELGVQVPGRVMLGADGSTLDHLDMPQVLTSWSRLYQMLRAAFPDARYHLGVSVQSVARDGDGLQVVTRGELASSPMPGSSTPEEARSSARRLWTADLVVAADGIRSTLRHGLFPEVRPRYAGYIAWRGVADEARLSALTRETLFPYFGFCVPPREQIIGYPVAGADQDTSPGRRAYNFVWYRPVPAGPALDDLMTDDDGVWHPQGIPPHKVAARHVAAMREDAHRLLAPQFADVLQTTERPFFQPIYDLACAHLHADGVVLLGDAAFVARPHLGFGVTKAADDAVALAQALRTHGSIEGALEAYAAQRLAAGRLTLDRARWLGHYMEHAHEANTLEPAARRHQVLHETAIDLERYGHRSAFRQVPPVEAAG
jgi:2-polyprenyl-6-methoxyphenol hydroxylase-like FAD-dependent oxidoreductase